MKIFILYVILNHGGFSQEHNSYQSCMAAKGTIIHSLEVVNVYCLEK